MKFLPTIAIWFISHSLLCAGLPIQRQEQAAAYNLVATGGGGGGFTQANHLSTSVADTSGTYSITTGSFTPQSSSLLVAVIGYTITTGNPISDLTVSGGSLTWTRRCSTNGLASGYYSGIELWTAPVSSAASMTITVSSSSASVTDGQTYVQAISFAGANSTQNGGSVTAKLAGGGADSGTGSITLSSAPASGDATIAARFYVPAGSTDPTATAGSGWNEAYDATAAGGGGYGGLQTQTRTNSTSATVAWTEIRDQGGITSAVTVECAFVVKGP